MFMLEEMFIHAITCSALYFLFIEFLGLKKTIGLILLLGIYKEYSDKMDGNYWDWFDMLGNIIGIGIGYLLNRNGSKRGI